MKTFGYLREGRNAFLADQKKENSFKNIIVTINKDIIS